MSFFIVFDYSFFGKETLTIEENGGTLGENAVWLLHSFPVRIKFSAKLQGMVFKTVLGLQHSTLL
ncbi:hypothetical protein [Maribellus sp. YY47]|uniref:hypothetical protein n=1 Tax=Maribellus sp. YY47 TaxID=2929486 RepID=UPI002001382E|nr:hypothetical protein [Maribellus sp. YY47]MCK3685315.1 hypothetical protein [Maribellus sp. YY47]